MLLQLTMLVPPHWSTNANADAARRGDATADATADANADANFIALYRTLSKLSNFIKLYQLYQTLSNFIKQLINSMLAIQGIQGNFITLSRLNQLYQTYQRCENFVELYQHVSNFIAISLAL